MNEPTIRIRGAKMKNIYILLGLLITACNTTQYYWEHESFSETPQMPLAQATAICKASALNVANSITQDNTYIPTTTTCNSYMYNSGYGHGSINTSCTQQEDGLAKLSAALRNKGFKISATENEYKSCMATNGWRAEYRAIESTDTEGIKNSAYKACLSSRKNEIIECEYSLMTIKEPICDCRVNGGQPKK